MFKRQKAFTLVELLVVIAIIGILAGMVTVSLSRARAKARDAKRKSDIAAIQTALNMYYDDNQSYPYYSNVGWVESNEHASLGWDYLANPLKPYLSTLPKDPTNTSGVNAWTGGLTYGYYGAWQQGCPAGSWYMLVYNLENKSDQAYAESPGVTDCHGYISNYGPSGNGITVGASAPTSN